MEARRYPDEQRRWMLKRGGEKDCARNDPRRRAGRIPQRRGLFEPRMLRQTCRWRVVVPVWGNWLSADHIAEPVSFYVPHLSRIRPANDTMCS